MKLKTAKKKLSKFLPQKIVNVVDEYDEFSKQEPMIDAKSFSAHHSACKTAISHIHSLLKLAETTDAKENADNATVQTFDLEAILKEANEDFEMEE